MHGPARGVLQHRGRAVLPAPNGQLDHPDLMVRNVVTPGVGHLTLAARPWVIVEIRALLLPAPPAEQRSGDTTVPPPPDLSAREF